MSRIKGLICAAVLTASVMCLGGCSLTGTTAYIYQDSEKYTAGDRDISDRIESIDIDYISGDVTLATADTDIVTIRETSDKELSEKMKVHSYVEGTTLHVRFCASAKNLDINNLNKRLEITLPSGTELSDLNTEVSSGDVDCTGIKADSVTIEASSGDLNLACEARNIHMEASSGEIGLSQTGISDEISLSASSGRITADLEKADIMSIETSSGKIDVTAGKIGTLKTETSSGESSLILKETPASADIEASSGDVTIRLPGDADLTLDVDTSGDLFYELAFSRKDGRYVSGSGANQMHIETSSGDINLLAD